MKTMKRTIIIAINCIALSVNIGAAEETCLIVCFFLFNNFHFCLVQQGSAELSGFSHKL